MTGCTRRVAMRCYTMIIRTDFDALVEAAQRPIGSPWLDMLYAQHEASIKMRINYYRFLYHLVQLLKPAVSIELGVEYGLGSAHMALAASEYGGKVIGIDIEEKDLPHDYLQPLDNYTYLIGNSANSAVFREVKRICGGQKVSIVFQDSSHHYAPSRAEWGMYSQLLAPGAVWICDDITPSFFEVGVDEKSMVAYFDELPGHHFKYPDVLHQGNTIGVVLL